MTISEWGILAEIVAAICVIITLAFLAYQIRQGNKEALISSTDSAIENYVKQLMMIQSPENSETVKKGLHNYSTLSAKEQAAFSSLLLGLTSTFLRVSDLYNAGLIPEEEFVATERNTARVVLCPGAYDWWQSTKDIYPKRVQERIDTAVEVKYKDEDPIFTHLTFFAETKADEHS